MRRSEGAGDTRRMRAATHSRDLSRGADLLIWHCSAFDRDRLPASDRLQQLIGAELTRLLVVALAGDHRMASRQLAA
jgi:hypothetical protein